MTHQGFYPIHVKLLVHQFGAVAYMPQRCFKKYFELLDLVQDLREFLSCDHLFSDGVQIMEEEAELFVIVVSQKPERKAFKIYHIVLEGFKTFEAFSGVTGF